MNFSVFPNRPGNDLTGNGPDLLLTTEGSIIQNKEGYMLIFILGIIITAMFIFLGCIGKAASTWSRSNE